MKRNNLFSNIYNSPYGHIKKFHLFDAAKNSRDFVQKLQLQRKIPVHSGCVNSICWNENGSCILSGSDDQKLAIVNGYDYSVLALVDTGHRANIFSAKFLPCSNDSQVVSCSGDGIIIYSNLNQPTSSIDNKFICHRGTAYEIMTVPNDPNTFLSCGEDKTVRWFDIRTKTSCNKEDCKDDILINCQAPVTSLAVNPLIPYQLAVGSADASVRIFDRRMLSTQSAGVHVSNGFQALMTCFTVPEFEHSRRITSLCYSSDGQEMLVSYSSDYIYLFDIKDDFEKKPKILCKDGPSTSNDPDNDSGLCFHGRPLMKRLRIRGDWSDTGPNARPESEAREVPPENASRNSIVRTMTDILTRMFNNSSQNSGRSDASLSTPASSYESSSEDINAVEASNENRERTSVTQETVLSETLPMDIDNSEPLTNEPSNLSTQDVVQVPLIQNPTDGNHDSVPSITYSAFESERPIENLTLTQTIETNNERKTCDKNPSDLRMDMDNNEEDPNRDVFPSLPGCSSNPTDNYDDIKANLESRRKDLIEK